MCESTVTLRDDSHLGTESSLGLHMISILQVRGNSNLRTIHLRMSSFVSENALLAVELDDEYRKLFTAQKASKPTVCCGARPRHNVHRAT